MTLSTDEPVTGTWLVERAQPLLPIDSGSAIQVRNAYIEFCKSNLSDDDYQRIGDKKFPKRTAFQALAGAYSVSTERRQEHIDRDPDGQILRARYLVRAVAPNGRYAEGGGACAIDERRFRSANGRDKLEHDVTATAETRATNRAISNLVAFGAISAEEANPEADAPDTQPVWARPADAAAFAEALDWIFAAIGVEHRTPIIEVIGEATFTHCDNTIPQCVLAATELIATQIITTTRERAAASEPQPPADASTTTEPEPQA